MGKIIRPTYPVEFSVGILLLVFAISLFLSGQVFDVPGGELGGGMNMYFGMFLVSGAVIIMVLILWEELLFPVTVKPVDGGLIFRNHRTKLKTQLLIYCIMPAIFVFVYMRYEVNEFRFMAWAAVCLIAPIAGKLISGIKNYNDFLKLTEDKIEYKNNEKEGVFAVKDIQQITLIKDENKVLHKVQLQVSEAPIIIDLDEMELDAFYIAIDKYIASQYKNLVK